MATTISDFKKYISDNKNNLDKTKLTGLSKDQTNALYNEWKTTGSLGSSYFKNSNTNKKNTTSGTTTTNNSSKVYDTIKNKYGYGSVSEGNSMSGKLSGTISSMETRNKDSAKEKEDILKSGAKEESDAVKSSNTGARSRAEENQSTLDKNKERDYSSNEDRRTEADDLLKRQEAIAARQANISAAKAGSSGLQMSESAVNDVKNDIIAKYGENLANAEEFRLQTNMTLDTALQNIDSNYFKNKGEIDTLLNSLDESESKPLINAVQKATEGNIQAVEDVKTYYNALTQKKADEEYNRMAEEERYADNEKTWSSADTSKKQALLQAELKTLGVTNPYISNPEKYASMSFQEALNAIANDTNNKTMMDEILAQATYSGSLSSLPEAFKKYAENAAKSGITAQKAIDTKPTTTLGTSYQMIGNKGTGSSTELKDSTKADLDKKISAVGKDKTVEGLRTLYNNSKITDTQYNRMINYINSLK